MIVYTYVIPANITKRIVAKYVGVLSPPKRRSR